MRANEEATGKEDIDAAVATFDPQSPVLESTRKVMQLVFETYDLKYTYEELTVESVNGDEARVHYVQLTEKVNGPEFRNNRLRGTHVLKKRDGAWRMFTSVIEGIDYLD